MIAQGSDVEVQVTDSTVAEFEPGPTWREALLACVQPADHHLSDEDIFTILNGEGDDAAVALLCDTKGVTLPMYCVLKLKYRQFGLEQLRKVRRREQWRRHAAIGAVALVATLFIAGIGVALVGAVASSVKSVTAAPSLAEAEPERRLSPASPPVQMRTADVKAREERQSSTLDSARAKPRSSPEAVAPITETGYRIQVTAAETEQEGRALVAQLASKGYPTYMTRATVGNRDVFRVRVGPFETLPMAEEVATQLRSAGYEGAWIVR